MIKYFRGHMIEWHGKEVLNAAKHVLGEVSKEVADIVMKDARRILIQKATTTTERGLKDQFDVRKSKFKDGGYLVFCQGPYNWRPPYHASFMEMGTYKDDAKPFMRPAIKKNIRKANQMFQDALDNL